MIVQRHIEISATKTVPLMYGDENYTLERVVVLPQTALAASGSNYFEIVLKHYEGDGTVGLGIPLDEKTGLITTQYLGLVVGRPIIVPQVGYISEAILKDTSLYAVCTLTGTATLDVLFQLQVTPKRAMLEDPAVRMRRHIASLAGLPGFSKVNWVR